MDTHNGFSPLSSALSPLSLSPQSGHNPAEQTTQLEAELTRLLYSQSSPTFLATLINASILATVLQPVLPATQLLAWLITIYVITGARFALVRRHERLSPTATQEDYWRRLYILGAVSNGAAWGSLCLFLFPADLPHQVFIAFVFGGMGAGAATILSSVPFAPLAFLVPTLAPLSLQFFLQGGSLGTGMGAMILIFFGSIVLIERHIRAAVVETLELRFTQLGLLDRLTTQTMDLEKTNTSLQEEIAKHQQTEQALRESEQRYRELFENANDGIATFTLDGVLTNVNRGIEHMLGWSREEMIGHHHNEFATAASSTVASERTRGALVGEKFPSLFELELLHKQGTVVPVEGRARLMRDQNGAVTGVQAAFRDITDRKQAEEELRKAHEQLEQRVQERTAELHAANQQLAAEVVERQRAEEALRRSEAYFRALIEDGSDFIAILGINGTIKYASPSHKRLLGYEVEELLGKEAFSFVHPDDVGTVLAAFNAGVQETGVTKSVEFRFRHKDGSWRVVESIGKNLLDDPVIAGVIVNSRDITDRTIAEETIKKNEERFRALIENSTDVIMILDTDGTIRYRSPTASGRGIHGYRIDELVGRNVLELVHPDDHQKLREVFLTEVLARPGVTRLPPFRALHSDGSWRLMEGTHNNLLHHPVIAGIIYTGRDITARSEAELALQESEARYRALIESTYDLIQSVDPEGRFLFVNAAWLNALGYTQEELPQLHLYDVIHPDFHTHCQQILSKVMVGESVQHIQVAFVAKNGVAIPVEGNVTGRHLNGKLVATHGFFRDISERQQAEQEKQALQAQLAQAQKLQSLGTLAGGVAHDFNNLLTPIIGFSELLKKTMIPGTVARNNLEEVLKASHRAKELVQQLLAFSRPSQQTRVPVALNEVLNDCLILLRAGLPSTIVLRASLDPMNGLVLADPTQLRQVLMNLGVNALQAMEGQGGVLDITVEQESVTDAFAALHPPLTPGLYCKLTVRDTGCGISPEVQARMFDPFFTTKEVGKGSGLGLSVVHGIVTNHGGASLVDSAPGEGATFEIYLPRFEGTVELVTEEDRSFAPGRGRILIVDDEQTVLLLMQQLLEELGYEAVPCTTTEEALALFRQESHRFDALIADQTMPGLKGVELAQAVRSFCPELPIIICSGSDLMLPEGLASERGNTIFIKKPFPLKKLAQALQQVFHLEEEEVQL